LYSILVVGNYCHDTLINERGTFEELGGSSAYSGAVLAGLGADFAVVSKVGEDFKYAGRVARPARIVPHAPTTRFEDDYRTGVRVAKATARCEAITPSDLGEKAEVGIAAAVAGEVPPETLLALRGRCRRLLCDVQGLVRRFDAEGRVSHVKLEETPFYELVDKLDFLTTSRDEVGGLDLAALRRRTRVIVTEDRDGCRVLDGSSEMRLPAHPARLVDPTGAGDSFLAGFAYGLSKGFEVERAARFANFCGAKAVSQVGLPEFSMDEVRATL
jgi:1D-myo-inositol 3-kinase